MDDFYTFLYIICGSPLYTEILWSMILIGPRIPFSTTPVFYKKKWRMV